MAVIRKAAAGAVVGTYVAVAATAVGAGLRGPFADRSVTRDFLTGAGVLAAGLAVRWAMRELDMEPAQVEAGQR